eukprot:5387576-Amphidinium_carterae.1
MGPGSGCRWFEWYNWAGSGCGGKRGCARTLARSPDETSQDARKKALDDCNVSYGHNVLLRSQSIQTIEGSR